MPRLQIITTIVVLALVLLTPLPAWAPPPSLGRPGAAVFPYNAGYYPPQTIAPLCQGQTITVPVRVVNYGTLTWNPRSFSLSYHWYTGPNVVVPNGLRTPLSQRVRPTQTVTLQAQLQAPATPGTYTLKWDMLQAGTTWFSMQGVATTDQTVAVSDALCLKVHPGRLVPAVRDITIVDCASIRCAAGTHCEATGMGPACVPDVDCASIRCAAGTHCEATGMGPACVPDARPCGKASCPAGQVCCNASCGICTPPGAYCIQIACK